MMYDLIKIMYKVCNEGFDLDSHISGFKAFCLTHTPGLGRTRNKNLMCFNKDYC